MLAARLIPANPRNAPASLLESLRAVRRIAPAPSRFTAMCLPVPPPWPGVGLFWGSIFNGPIKADARSRASIIVVATRPRVGRPNGSPHCDRARCRRADWHGAFRDWGHDHCRPKPLTRETDRGYRVAFRRPSSPWLAGWDLRRWRCFSSRRLCAGWFDGRRRR